MSQIRTPRRLSACLTLCLLTIFFNAFTGGAAEAFPLLYAGVWFATVVLLFFIRPELHINLVYLLGALVCVIALRQPLTALTEAMQTAMKSDVVYSLILGGVLLGLLLRNDLAGRSASNDSHTARRVFCMADGLMAKMTTYGRWWGSLLLVTVTAFIGSIASALPMAMLGQSWFGQSLDRMPKETQRDQIRNQRILAVHCLAVVGAHGLWFSIQWKLLSGTILATADAAGRPETVTWLGALGGSPWVAWIYALGIAVLGVCLAVRGGVFAPDTTSRVAAPQANRLVEMCRRRYIFYCVVGLSVAFFFCVAINPFAAGFYAAALASLPTLALLAVLVLGVAQTLALSRHLFPSDNKAAARISALVSKEASTFFSTVLMIVLLIGFSSLFKSGFASGDIDLSTSINTAAGFTLNAAAYLKDWPPLLTALACGVVTAVLAYLLGSIYLSLGIGWGLFWGLGLHTQPIGQVVIEATVLVVFACNLLGPQSPNFKMLELEFNRQRPDDHWPPPHELLAIRLGRFSFRGWLLGLTTACVLISVAKSLAIIYWF